MSDKDVHVVPLNDLLEHSTDSGECMCDPKVIVEGAMLIYVHNSYDGREDRQAQEGDHAFPQRAQL